MIDLVTGVPGSGKTYYTVYQINELLTKKKDKNNYKHIYTNINGFDYKKANAYFDKSDFVKPFDFNDLKKHINNEFTQYQQYQNGLLPDILDYDNYIKNELHIYEPFFNSLIIVDECHLYFTSKADDSLIRFLSYHRHFDIDLIICTQNKNLVNKQYLSFIETLIKAYPGSKRFFSNVFRYKKFASYQEYNANVIGTFSLPLKKQVFELYNSGSTKLSKSVLKKMFLPIVFLIIFLFLFYHFFISNSLQKKSDPQKFPISHISNNIINSNKHTVKKIYSSDKKPYIINCYHQKCYFLFSDYSFNLISLDKIFATYNCSVFNRSSISKYFSSYLVNCDSNIQNFIKIISYKKGVSNVKNSNFTGSFLKP